MKKIILFILFISAIAGINKVNAQINFTVKNPANLAGAYTFEKTVDWGALLDTMKLTDTLVIARDSSVADSCACNAIDTSKVNIKGKIAVIYRGLCNFSVKALNAQNAGAVGVIIIQNKPDPVFPILGGGDITIPVIMISQADGAKLRPAIDAKELIAFMGNKSGLYANDLGFQLNEVVRARSFAIPSVFAKDSSSFSIPLGAMVHNYGSMSQSNISLTAIITLKNDTVYKNSASLSSLNAGDSAFINLPKFAKPTYASGFYNIKYKISADNPADYPSDDSVLTNFWINDSLKYSKSRFSEDSLKPIITSSSSSTTEKDMIWCVTLNESSYDTIVINSISFSAETKAPKLLTGDTIGLEVYKWSDQLYPGNNPTFNSLELVGSGFYNYTENLQNQLVTGVLDSPVLLENGKKYLACIHKKQDSLNIGTDRGIDYTTSLSADKRESFFPLYSGGQWFSGGFGPNYVPGIVVNLKPKPKTVLIKERINACIKYDWRGKEYSGTGIYRDTIKRESDSLTIFELNLTIKTPRTLTIKTPLVLSNNEFKLENENAFSDSAFLEVKADSNHIWEARVGWGWGSGWLTTKSQGIRNINSKFVTGNGRVSIEARENTGEAPRKGLIWIRSINSVCSELDSIITIIQPGKSNSVGCDYSNSKWKLQNSGIVDTGKTVFAFAPTSDQNVWAIIENGDSASNEFKRTVDGGKTWKTGTITNANNYKFTSISALNKDTAYVSMCKSNSEEGYIFKTIDGGNSWKILDTNMFKNNLLQVDSNTTILETAFLNFVHFFDAQNGVAVGDPTKGYFEIYTTSDAGDSWKRIDSSKIPIKKATEIVYWNVYSAVGNNLWFGTNQSRIFKTENRGLNWTVSIVDSINSNKSIQSIAFKDSLNGICSLGASGPFKTEDGGKSWKRQTYESGAFGANRFHGLIYAKGAKGIPGRYFNMDSKNLSFSTDDGLNWTLMDTMIHSSAGFWDVTSGWTNAFDSLPRSTKIYKLEVCIPPTAPRAQNDTICAGEKAKLIAKGSGNITWYDAAKEGNLLGKGDTLITDALKSSTSFYAQDSTCNISLSRTKVDVFVKPMPDLSTNLSGNTISSNQYNATYKWLNCSNGFTLINGANGQTFTPVVNGEYAVLVYYAGCSDTSTCVKICTPPNAPIAKGDSICAGESIVIKASGNGNITWHDAPKGGILIASGNSLTLDSLRTSKSFYVQDSTCDISLSRTKVDVIVKPMPDLSTNLSGNTISSNQYNGTYKWLNCSNGFTLINGANGQTFTPIVNGEYAVLIDYYGCSDTTKCIKIGTTGINRLESQKKLDIFPNPSKGKITITGESEGNYEICNELGQIITRFVLNQANKNTVSIENLQKGLYYLIGNNGQEILNQKIVVIE